MRNALKPIKKILVFAIFCFRDMIDFVLKILRKLTKMSPCMTKLLSSAPIFLKNAFQKILR